MPYNAENQTAPLAYTGVPDNQTVQTPAPVAAPPIQPPPQQQTVLSPSNSGAVQDQALNNDQNLLAALNNQSSGADTLSLLSALAGIAGNIGGAMQNQGAVGNSALQYAAQVQQQKQAQQQEQMQRIYSQEQRLRQDLKMEDDRQGRELRAKSLYPLIATIPEKDKEMRDALMAQIASGDVDGAQAAFRAYGQDKQRQEVAGINADIKRERADIAQERLRLAQEDDKRKDEAFNLGTPHQRELILYKDIEKIKKEVAPVQDSALQMAKIDALLGGVDSNTSNDRIAEIAGLKTAAATSPFAGKKQAQLAQNLVSLYNSWGKAISGAQVTPQEAQRLRVATGFNFDNPQGFNPKDFKNVEQIKQGLIIMKDIINNRMQSAGAGVRPEAMQRYMDQGGFSPKAYMDMQSDVRKLGPVDLDTPPVANDTKWGSHSPAEKVYILKRLRGIE